IKIEPTRHAPPICTFIWSDQFPGSSLNGDQGSAASQAAGAAVGWAGGANGKQRRNGFQCIVGSGKKKVKLFSPDGVPLRATLTVALREYKSLDEQLAHLNRTSPDRTQSHVTQSGETLSGIAAQFYQRPGDWRFIADANHIEDPRRLPAGA